MPYSLPAALTLAAARAWIGTKWVPRAACRGAGADCAGLIRGVIRDLTGRDLPAPPWDAQGASWGQAMLDGARAAGLERKPGTALRPGDVVAFRVGRRAHAGISTGAGVIHADTLAGVVETPGPLCRALVAAWSIPAEAAPYRTVQTEDLLAVIYAPEKWGGNSFRLEVVDQHNPGAPLIVRTGFPTLLEILELVDPWNISVESV